MWLHLRAGLLFKNTSGAKSLSLAGAEKTDCTCQPAGWNPWLLKSGLQIPTSRGRMNRP